MINILALELVSLVSLLFGILGIFLSFTTINYMFLSYLWIVLVSLSASILYGKNKNYRFLLILGFLPLLFFNGRTAFSFFLLVVIIIFLYIQYGLNKGQYEELVRRFKASFLTLGGLAILAIISSSIRETIGQSILFFMIYILSTIIQIRSIRHLESGMDTRTLRKINTRYIILMSIFSIIAVVDSIRNFIFSLIGTVYQWIMSFFMFIIYYPVNLVLRLIDFIFKSRGNRAENIEMEAIDEPLDFNYEQGEAPEFLVSIISFVVSALVIVLVIFIVYRILRGLGDRVYNTIDYSEQKEYIKPKKRKRRIFKEKFPKNPREQVRYYYRRYLEKLQKKEIVVKKGDTSLDIKNKSKNEFTGTEEIRNIYIEARYKNEEPKKEKVEQIKNAYKKL